MFGVTEMERAGEVVALRALGLSLAQVARVLGGGTHGLEPALIAHEAALEGRMRHLVDTLERVQGVRRRLAEGRRPETGDVEVLLKPSAVLDVGFDLPWPWGGEWFEFRDVRPINYIVGPLGSGKTRLATRLAETVPGAVFLGLDRLEDEGAQARARLDRDAALKSRIEESLDWLLGDGAVRSAALVALLVGLDAGEPAVVVVDMVEQGLDGATQQAVVAFLRRRGRAGRAIFLMTRSSAILDLSATGADEAILLCPANHGPPTRVAPYPGSPGYEAVATCLASPEVRARTDGVIAWPSRGVAIFGLKRATPAIRPRPSGG